MGAEIKFEFIFNPNWWNRNYGISFAEPFYLDPEARMRNDVLMRQALQQRFGLGEAEPKPRPVLGCSYVAGGFVVPALLGAKVRFSEGAPPFPVPANLDEAGILQLKVPDIKNTWPMNLILQQAAALRREYGYVTGDMNTDGVLNTALLLRGEQLFLDFHDNPELVRGLLEVVAKTTLAVATTLKGLSGTCSVSVNRSIINLDPSIFLHANCTLQMISAAVFERFLLPWELFLSQHIQPYGIHHCGSKMHQFARHYSRVPAVFFDVGWGSDVRACRRELPHAFFNLRLSPVRMLERSAQEMRQDAVDLLQVADGGRNAGLCCINMDYGTPDENVRSIIEVAEEYTDRLRAERNVGDPQQELQDEGGPSALTLAVEGER